MNFGSAAPARNINSSETIYISPLALIKMIKHGRTFEIWVMDQDDREYLLK